MLGIMIKFDKTLRLLDILKKSKKRSCFQTFLKDPKSTLSRKIYKMDELSQVKKIIKRKKICLIIHTTFLCTLSNLNKKVIKSIYDDIYLCSYVGGYGVVFHIGYKSKKRNSNVTVLNFLKIIDKIMTKLKNKNIKILLENSSGQINMIGNNLSYFTRFKKKYIGICIDTAHLWGAGYDLRKTKTLRKLIKTSKEINVKLIHLNNTETKWKQKGDVHSNLNKGEIPLTSLLYIANYALNNGIPIILETPYEGIEEDINILNALKEKK